MNLALLPYDCLQLVLQHLCRLHVAIKSRPLRASIASVSGNTVCEISEDPALLCTGFIGRKQTLLLSFGHGGFIEGSNVVRATDLDHVVNDEYDLCLQMTFDDDCGLLDEHRFLFNEFVRSPCMGWGCKRQLGFTIALSKALREEVCFDVHVVPNSLWLEEVEGDFAILQMTYADEPPPEQIVGVEEVFWEVAGWKA